MKKTIIGYFHICQKDNWERSFDMIFSEIKNSGLYDATKLIRVGIVNDESKIIENYRLNDPKFEIIFCNNSSEYERPTLYHMRTYSEIDDESTCYWYVHTKGLRHFGSSNESCIIDWINLLLYWNITKWKIAYDMLFEYDTYGCNSLNKIHYSGNFWWANSTHVKSLSTFIPDYYTAPEDYICTKKDKMFSIWDSCLAGMGHYNNNLPKNVYEIPDDFNIHVYHNANSDLNSLLYEELIKHYLDHGKYENKTYKLPEGFDFDYYRNNKKLYHYLDKDLIWHWYKYGQYEGIKFCA